MASKSFCFWSFIIVFCVHLGSRVQGNELQQADKGIDGSVKNTSTLYASASTDVPIEDALYSESDGNRIESDTSKIYIESGSIWDQPLSASILDASDQREQEFAMLRTYSSRFLSAKATMSVHAANNTDINQQSVAGVWVMNLVDGPPRRGNIISAGWHVHPTLYGDKGTRFFVAWLIVDGNSTKGCYNLRCKGFVVHKNTTYIPGSLIKPLSIYNGEQWYITVKITLDSQTGDWWLYHGPNGDKPVGYWSKTLFTILNDSATNVDIGGAVVFDRGEKGPPMGSGVFPVEGEGKAASLTNLELNNKAYDGYDKIFYYDQTLRNWYQIGGYRKKTFFGGPGGYNSD